MAVVVTGSTGFIGRHLVHALVAAGHQVLALDRRPATGLPAGAWPLVADLLDAEAADALLDAEAVFHLAARPGVRGSGGPESARTELRLRHRDNVLATAAVLAATPLSTPLVVTSSSSVYGGTARPGRPSRETDPLRPRGGYARSKVEVEQLCEQRRAAGGAVAVARPFTVAGEGQRPDMALARWITATSAGRPVTVLGSPLRTRDVTDVRDVVCGLQLLAEVGLGRTVNLGTGVSRPLTALLDAVCAAVRAPVEVRSQPAAYDEVADTCADTRRCQRLLGFTPSTDLDEVVRRQVAAAGVETCEAARG
ncbi:MAG TPA: NAD(P)-dependent oxidoreductase [Mycobacteriales bacterium]|nr:NAD(P)-dependent oxidoreductase [Mycobacteriales bacterium]